MEENQLLIGLGGTGFNVLKAFRTRLWTEYPDQSARAELPVKFIYVDSDSENTPAKQMGRDDLRVAGQDIAITPDEFVNIKSVDLSQILNNLSSYPGLKHVIKNGSFMRENLGEVGKAAAQKRRAGRILFAANARDFNAKVSKAKSALHALSKKRNLHVHIFTGLAGGTGSGSIVDAVSQILVNHPEAKVDVYAMIPELDIPDGCQAGRYHQNGYAALLELNALNVGRFLPSNVITGEEHITLPNPSFPKQFGLTVYSNVNNTLDGGGYVVDSFTTLPALLADAVYFRTMSPKSESLVTLNRYMQNENLLDFVIEYKTDTKKGADPVRARTKAIGSFGIKRIMYPEAEIMEHVSFNVARVIFHMMRYMNFTPERGFVNEPPRKAKDYAEYVDDSNLGTWYLDDDHLSLSVPLLEGPDSKKPRFNDFWINEVSNYYTYEDARAVSKKEPLAIVEQYFEDTYANDFRNGMGVVDYFKSKANDDVLNSCVYTVMNRIETTLFDKWAQGVYSVYDLQQITRKILEILKRKRDGLANEISEVKDKIEKYTGELSKNREDMRRVGLIVGMIGNKQANIFATHGEILADLYDARTRLESLTTFQELFIPRLVQRFEEFLSEIGLFIAQMDETEKTCAAIIANAEPEDGLDISQNTIEVWDGNRLSDFEKRIKFDRNTMDNLASAYRKAITNGKFSFKEVSSRINSPRKLKELTLDVLNTQIAALHSEMMRNSPVLGLNVLKQLHELYKTEDEIRSFAQQVIDTSNVFIQLNKGELDRSLPNNPNPMNQPETINHKVVLISIPTIDSDDTELAAFAESLKNGLSVSFSGEANSKLVFYESPRKNEITVMVYQNLFPLRAVESLKRFEGEYNSLVNGPNDSTNQQNRILLHIEGDGSNLPPLYGEGDGVKGDDLIKYLFIAAACGAIRYGEDENGIKGWGVVEIDDFDQEDFVLISPRFVDIVTSEALSPERLDYIVEKANDFLEADKHATKKAAAAESIKNIIKEYVVKEAGGSKTEKYNLYAGKAREAMAAVQK